MKQSALEQRVAPSERILIDTSVLIAYFEPSDATHAIAALLIDDFIQTGKNIALVSPISAMELLVRPLRVAPKRAPRSRFSQPLAEPYAPCRSTYSLPRKLLRYA